MNPTGGLLWHARAWRRQGAWRGTCGQIGQWLGEVRPISRELVIIGASAGWMMPSAWLQRFEKISTFDIDRWAAPLFRLRHGAVLRRSGVDLRCHTSDAIGRLDEVLAENPRAAVLFDNVLGQLRFCTLRLTPLLLVWTGSSAVCAGASGAACMTPIRGQSGAAVAGLIHPACTKACRPRGSARRRRTLWAGFGPI